MLKQLIDRVWPLAARTTFGLFPRLRCDFDLFEGVDSLVVVEKVVDDTGSSMRDCGHNLVTISANKKGLHACKPFVRPEVVTYTVSQVRTLDCLVAGAGCEPATFGL